MKFRIKALAALTALLMSVQGASAVFAVDETAPGTDAAASASETADTAAASDVSEEPVVTVSTDSRLLMAEQVRAEEDEFLGNNPELAELGEYVFEGDSVPCSENDPSFHKYIRGLMDGLSEGEELASPIVSMSLGFRLLSSAVYGADSLVHQERYAQYPRTYGIDVSYYQGKIDWETVKKQGISFAILRAGYRGYGKAGTLVLDDRFLEYLKGAKAAGLEVGVYFYTQAITVAEAKEEADFVYKYIKGYKLDLPVYFDMETVEGAVGRLDASGLGVEEKTDLVEAFCDRIAELGYKPGVYSNPQWLTYYLNAKRLQAKYPLWLANYTTNTKYAGNFDIWQYGAGYVEGVSSARTDLNVRYHFYTPPAAPENFRTADDVSDSVQLCWDAVPDAKGYEVFKKDSKGVTTSLGKQTTLKKDIALGSTTDTYYVKAYIVKDNKTIYGEASQELVLSSYVPTDLGCSARTTDSLTLSWTGVENAIRYYISMYNSETGRFSLIGDTTDTSYKLTELAPSTAYRFKIKAVTKIDGAVAAQRFTPEFTAGTQGKKVTGLKFVTKTADSVSIKWTKTDSACAGYEVQRYDETRKQYVSAGTTNQTEFTVYGLEKASAYKFRVRSFYRCKETLVYSVESGVLNCATMCDAPASLSVRSTDSSYTVSWKAPAGANGYMVYAAKQGSTPVKLGETDQTKYTVSGLAKGLYSVYVRPYIKLGNTRYYGVSSATLTAVCGKTAPTVKTASTTNSITASWNAVPYASSYKAYIMKGTAGSYSLKATLGSDTKKYTFTGLEDGEKYTVMIRSIFPDNGNMSGYSVISTVAVAKTPSAPVNIKATTATDTTVTVVWDKAANASKYKAYLYDETAKKYVLKGTVSELKYTYTGLKSGTMYKMKIYSVSSSGSTKASAVYNITPKPAAPKLGLASKTETSATLKWDAAPLCSKYYIYKLDPLKNTFVKIATSTSTSYTVKNLNVGTRNIFKIKAVASTNAANFNSLFSSQLSVLTKGIKYYAPCSEGCITLYQAFDELGLEKSFAFQEKIAVANAIKGYEGTAEQNTAMLNTLKKGKLIIPQF